MLDRIVTRILDGCAITTALFAIAFMVLIFQGLTT